MKSINGRLLRPAVCSCAHGCRSRDEMFEQHGSIERFENALGAAIVEGMITPLEADIALRRYRDEWRAAPQHTQVDKPLSEADQRTLDKVVGLSGQPPETVRKALDWLVSGKKPGER